MAILFQMRPNGSMVLEHGSWPLPQNGTFEEIASEVAKIVSNTSGDQIRSYIAIVVFSVVVISFVHSTLFSTIHLRDFSGPWWAAYSRFWLSKTLASTNSAQVFVDTNKKYGSISRIGPNHLVTDDPELTRTILAVGSKWRRGPWFDAIRIDPRVPNIVSERDIRKHNAMRRRMSAGYAGKDIEGLEDVVDERITEFINSIDKNWLSAPGQTRLFDIARRVQFFTIDTITHVCFGKPMGFVESDTDMHNFIATIEQQLPIVQHFSVFLYLNTVLRWAAKIPSLRRLVVPSSADKSGIGVVMGLSRKVIDDRLSENEAQKHDMLGSFMKRGLTPEQAEMEISISLVAGSDTTATAIRATLLAVISTPTVYQRLVQEIATAEREGRISSPVCNTEAQSLPYLQAVIREGLRRFPPITQLREREAPPEGMELPDGRHIPGGTFVGLNAWGTQLHPVFGDDPHVFRPERWLQESYDDDGAQLAAMAKVQELVFGHGMTRCLGIPIAMMNLNKMFVELFRRYDIQCINSQRPWTSLCYGIFFQRDFNVRISRREILGDAE
ncbi:Cytochrome P450 monooxygenase lolP1 [Colletotrichum siamense]|nr:Cytochrome P450 monooxygenase lolP1 [Colletotrichum siamense]